jgi:hypothetical protein
VDAPLTLAIGAAGLVSFFLFWMFCKKVVRLGFFLLALTIGATLAAATMFILQGKVDPGPVAIAALTFAWLWTTIRAKVARLISIAAVVAFASVAGEVDWLQILDSEQATVSAQKTTQSEPASASNSRTKDASP